MTEQEQGVKIEGQDNQSIEDLKVNTNTYDDKSIKSLKGADRVRRRPGVMFGTNDIHGAFHTVKEVVGNSLDESRAGFGRDIFIKLYKDKSISVRDYGRGVPMGWNEEEGRYNWDLIFNELYAGGKYEAEGTDDSVYDESVGLNGLGVTSTQYTSEYFNVISYRDTIVKKNFERGIPLDEDLEEVPNDTGKTGTFIKWKIDPTVFTNTNITFKMLKKYCESQAHLEGVNFHLEDEVSGEVLVIEGKSISEYLKMKVGDKGVDLLSMTLRDNGYEDNKKYSVRCNLAMVISNEMDSVHMYYHNSADMTVGVHSTAYTDAVTKFFKPIGKEHDVSITASDYRGYINVLISSYSNSDVISYANQTKTGVSNRFIYDIIFKTVTKVLEDAKAKELPSYKQLVENVVTSAYARKKAKELEMQLKTLNKANNGKKSSKLDDCRNEYPKYRELFIVEGDSAKTSCKFARDRWTQAIIPIKGKIINCLKSSLEDLLNNDEIQSLIGTLGCGVEIRGTDISDFDIKKCNYDKIIIATDADVDGYQIRVLLFLFFYVFMPSLLERVFVVETPLYEIVLNREKSIFAYTEAEKLEKLNQLEKEGKKYKKINRSKGLGENNADMLWGTTMNPETRHLIPLAMNVNDPMVKAIINMLFGTDENKERKGFIFSMLEEGLGETGLGDVFDTVNALEGVDIDSNDLVI